ncbi:hypothetical protein V6R21_00355 [Limibacter armeniacum]|uniref:hypothetical protein n=1 Tax=Limibacter armeniacum TaxID=466084 RepID=UPI002FE6A785
MLTTLLQHVCSSIWRFLAVFLLLIPVLVQAQQSEIEPNNSVSSALSSANRYYTENHITGSVTSTDSDFWIISRSGMETYQGLIYYATEIFTNSPNIEILVHQYEGTWGSGTSNTYNLEELKNSWGCTDQCPLLLDYHIEGKDYHYAFEIKTTSTSAQSYDLNLYGHTYTDTTPYTNEWWMINPPTTAVSSIAISENVANLDLTSFTAISDTVSYVVKMNTSNSFANLESGFTTLTGSTDYVGGEQVVYVGNNATPNLTITGLSENTTYYFKVYPYSNLHGYLQYNNSGTVVSKKTCGALPGQLPMFRWKTTVHLRLP